MKGLFILLALLSLALPGLAQEDVPVVEYGQVVSGQITNRTFEVEYGFAGAEGDVILAEMKPVEGASNNFHSPAIVLLDADYNVLETANGYSLGVTLFAQLPASGEYSLLATRQDGRAGDSVGEFTLKLSKLRMLKDGETVGGKAHPQTIDYYAVETRIPFTVAYERKTRGFYPQVGIAVIRDYGLYEIASLKGETLVSGAIGIAPETPDSQLYIVMVQSTSYYGDSQETVEYAITLDE